MAENGTGFNASSIVPTTEVLAERIGNISKKLDEQIAASKTDVAAALTAISVAKTDQERTVTVAFASSQLAISKTEQAQKESNQAISTLQNDVVRLKEAQAQSKGVSGGAKEMYGYVFAAVLFLVSVGEFVFLAMHR